MKMCKYANVQVCKCASVYMCKCVNVQVCKSASIKMCKDANVQVCKCAIVSVSVKYIYVSVQQCEHATYGDWLQRLGSRHQYANMLEGMFVFTQVHQVRQLLLLFLLLLWLFLLLL